MIFQNPCGISAGRWVCGKMIAISGRVRPEIVDLGPHIAAFVWYLQPTLVFIYANFELPFLLTPTGIDIRVSSLVNLDIVITQIQGSNLSVFIVAVTWSLRVFRQPALHKHGR